MAQLLNQNDTAEIARLGVRMGVAEQRYAEIREVCEEIKDMVAPVCTYVAENRETYAKVNTLWDERNKHKGVVYALHAIWAAAGVSIGWIMNGGGK